MQIVCDCGNQQDAGTVGYEVPKDAVQMRCNFCPKCEDDAGDYYEEWFVDEKGEVINEDSSI